jgi:hypothetical protein
MVGTRIGLIMFRPKMLGIRLRDLRIVANPTLTLTITLKICNALRMWCCTVRIVNRLHLVVYVLGRILKCHHARIKVIKT